MRAHVTLSVTIWEGETLAEMAAVGHAELMALLNPIVEVSVPHTEESKYMERQDDGTWCEWGME